MYKYGRFQYTVLMSCSQFTFYAGKKIKIVEHIDFIMPKIYLLWNPKRLYLGYLYVLFQQGPEFILKEHFAYINHKWKRPLCTWMIHVNVNGNVNWNTDTPTHCHEFLKSLPVFISLNWIWLCVLVLGAAYVSTTSNRMIMELWMLWLCHGIYVKVLKTITTIKSS